MTPLTENFRLQFQRGLQQVSAELKQYKNPAACWQTAPGISNPAGNLALHLAGNLQHFIGALLGQSGYQRNRELEFSAREVPLEQINRELEHAGKAIDQVLGNMTEAQLSANYPVPFQEKTVQVDYMLLHLLAHLQYHLGQINYHRRLLDR